MKHASQKENTIGQLLVRAFYFLLPVGEYTKRGQVPTQTTQFCVCGIAFYKNNTIISHYTPLETLKNADVVTLRL